MATLASNVSWGSSPTITFDFSYSTKREGTSQYYMITVTCDPLTGSSYFGYPIYVDVKLDGVSAGKVNLKSYSESQWSSAISYSTGWVEFPNKTSGTTSLAIRIYSGSGSTRDTTYSYTLPVDPAVSTITATDANIESTSVITIAKYDANFTTTVSYKAAGQSNFTPIWEKEAHTSYGWTIPSSLYSLIPNAKEIEVTLQCETYNGSTLMGTETCTLTATANLTKCAPGVSINARDINMESKTLTGNNKFIINGISDLRVETAAEAKNSATITSIAVYCGGSVKNGTDVTFNGADSAAVHVIVTDSRGFSTKLYDQSLKLINYITPTITHTITRDTPTGNTVTVSVKGLWFNGSFGAATNTIQLKVAYKRDGEGSYSAPYDMTVTKGANDYTATINLSGLDYTNAYRFQIRLYDSVYKDGKEVSDIYLSKGIPVFDWGENDFRFNVPVQFLDQAIFKTQTVHFKGDANEVTYNAILRTTTGATNCPSDNGFLIAFAPVPGQVIFQIGCDFKAASIKCRTYWYGTWNDWKTFS